MLPNIRKAFAARIMRAFENSALPPESRPPRGGVATAFLVLWYVFLVLLHIATIGLFVPWWVAVHRRVPNAGSVIVIDVFLGWTLIGWAVALAMACRSIPVEKAPAAG